MVRAPRELAMVGRMMCRAQLEKRVARGAGVAVEQYGLLPARAGAAAINPVLTAVAKP
jgi:hypothetical protein